jgi:hypothetical protein
VNCESMMAAIGYCAYLWRQRNMMEEPVVIKVLADCNLLYLINVNKTVPTFHTPAPHFEAHTCTPLPYT